MNRSSISDLLSLIVFQKYAAYLTLILLSRILGFAYSVRPYHLKLRSSQPCQSVQLILKSTIIDWESKIRK